MSMKTSHLTALFCLILALVLPACSTEGKQHKVKGALLHRGEPYLPKHKGSVTVIFVPEAEGDTPADSYVADVNREDGTFVVNGKTGRGIPPGKYRVTINQMVMDAPAEINQMNERFSATNSKIIRDIQDETPLRIDLAKADGN
jgi:hypothetical protein